MEGNLTLSEKKYLDDFLASAGTIKTPHMHPYVYAGILMLGGLILFATAVFLTLKSNFNDRVVYWVFLPCVFGQIVTVIAGTLIIKYTKKSEEKAKLTGIIGKLLGGG